MADFGWSEYFVVIAMFDNSNVVRICGYNVQIYSKGVTNWSYLLRHSPPVEKLVVLKDRELNEDLFLDASGFSVH
jgi:hypothetical protein